MSESQQPTSSTGSRRRWLIVIIGQLLLVGTSGLVWKQWPAPDIDRARRHYARSDFAAAQSELQQILADDPNHAAALLMMGDLLRNQGDRAGAVRSYSRVPPGADEFFRASSGQVRTLLEMSDLAEAEQQMQRHLESFPDSHDVWDELRWLCFNQFRTRDVEELSRWWLKTQPEDRQALTHLLLGLYRPQVPQEGTPYLLKAHEAVGQQVSVIRALAWAAWQSGQTDEAHKLLEQVWQISSDDPRTRLLSAEILIEEQNFADADRVLGSEPFGVPGAMFGGQVDRWHWLHSRILLEQNDIAGALAQVERAVDLSIGKLEYIHSQAMLLQQLGRDEEAGEVFSRARIIEQCRKRFAEIAFSGAWQHPTAELEEELADLYQQCGDQEVAELWRRLASSTKQRP